MSSYQYRLATDATKTKTELKSTSSLYMLTVESLLAAVVIISLMAIFFSDLVSH